MKKFISVILMFLTFVFASIFCFAKDKFQNTDVSVDIQKLNVVFDGNDYDGMNLYTIDDSKFISVRELATLLDARLEWYSVSKKVSLKLKNKTIDIYYDSRKVGFGKDKEKLSIPSILINNEVYIPIELVQLKKFSNASETLFEFNDKHNVLTISSKTNISAVRYYTRENDTEVVIELDEKMTHFIRKAKNSIVVSFQRGKIAKNSVVANNGVLKDISYETKNREAVFTINLEQTPKSVRAKKFKKPLKLVLEIEHSKPVDMAQPCNIYIPETVVASDNRNNTEVKILNETKMEKTEGNIKEEKGTKPVTEQEKNDISVPVIDTKIIATESQMYDKPKAEDEHDDSKALAKVQTVAVGDEQIVDDSYAIIDDTETFKDIVPKAKEISKTAKVIVLDAGHGGQDPGAIGPHGIKEKDINLAIVLYLEKLFKKDKNYKVILTRDDDTFIPLVERANIANKNKADLFISVHCNANLKRNVSGFEIYFLSENASDTEAISTEALENSVIALEDKTDEQKTVLQNMLWSMVVNEYINESSELSSFIVAEASGRLKSSSRGIKQANFYVLRGTQMPSVLVETAYISNYTEEAKLKTGSFQKSAADSIYEGVKKYYARKKIIKQ
jgi:N-acetylmuramoyl-L-alanine amidase